jgi:O-antigen/teichoic acid export membrane protein
LGFLRDAAQTLVIQAVAAGFQFVSGVALARSLQPEGRGAYALLTLLATIAVYVASLGFGNAAMRMVAKEPQRDGAAAAGAALVAIVAGTLFAGVIALGRAPLISFVGGGIGERELATALVAIPVLVLELHGGLVLTGQHAVASGNLAKALQAVLFCAGVIPLWWMRRLDVGIALLCWLASYVVADVFAWLAIGRRLTTRVTIERAVLADGLRFGLRALPGSLAMFLLFRVDLYLVRWFRPLDEVGVYAQATQLAVIFQLAARSIERAFVPRVIRASASDAARLTPTVTRSFVLVMSLAALATILLAFPLVPVFFGPAFAGASLQLALLLPGIVVANVGFLCNGDLQGQGRPGAGSIAAVVCLLLDLGLDCVAVPRFGALGAAAVSLVCYALYGVLLALHYRRVTGVGLLQLFVPRGADVAAVARMAQGAWSRSSAR